MAKSVSKPSFMGLPCELRLEIYRHAFTPTRRSCGGPSKIRHGWHCCWKSTGYLYSVRHHHVSNLGLSGFDGTCFRGSAGLLRVCKQVYHEALPIMMANVQCLFVLPQYDISNPAVRAQAASLFQLDEKAAKEVDRFAIFIPPNHGHEIEEHEEDFIISRIEFFLRLIQLHRPALRELRVRFDIVHDDSADEWNLATDRFTVSQVFFCILRLFRGITLYIDVGRTVHGFNASPAPHMEREVAGDVQEQAVWAGSDIEVRHWRDERADEANDGIVGHHLAAC